MDYYSIKIANVSRCPLQGYVPKIRQYNLPATLHTFGFGYSLKSGLLKSIAEIGNGNYAFIPDAGMIVCASSNEWSKNTNF
jgi:hypothetical protein